MRFICKVFLLSVLLVGCEKDKPLNCNDVLRPEDVLDCFQGNVVMEIYKYYASQNVILYDTTYTDTIELIKDGSAILINYPEENISRELNFSNRDTAGNFDYYYMHVVSPANSCRVYLYYSTDSIIIINRTGGISNINIWEMKGKK